MHLYPRTGKMRWLGLGTEVLAVIPTVESLYMPLEQPCSGTLQAVLHSSSFPPPARPPSSARSSTAPRIRCLPTRKRRRTWTFPASIASMADCNDDITQVEPVEPLPRIDVSGLSPSQVASRVDFSKPCILTGVLDLPECEGWCDALLEDLGGQVCTFQIRDNESGRSELFRASLLDFIQGLQEESTHEESWYLLEEDLLGLPNARAELGALLAKPQELLGSDEFELFPASVRPQNLCAIIGGVGARSFLHGDPMEWMGWNILIEGRKTWTFLPPLPELDAALGTYRLSPNAFGSHNISAGWQSDMDLYRCGSRTSDGGAGGITCASWPGEGGGHEVMRHAVSGVQEVGELVLIPPRYWHQVYHLEPSVAVASQFMNHRVRHRVFRHILDWCGDPDSSCSEDVLRSSKFGALTPASQIREVLRAALVARYGHDKGADAFASLGYPHESSS